MRRKPWWQSRTLWVAFCFELLAAVAEHLALLQGVLPARVYQWLAFAVPVVMVIMRHLTTMPIGKVRQEFVE